jgi:hypothetical protein
MLVDIVTEVSHSYYLYLCSLFLGELSEYKFRFQSKAETETRLKIGNFGDYVVFLMNKDNLEFIKHLSRSVYDMYPDRVFVCCLDDESYDAYASWEGKGCTYWTLDLEQTMDLIRLNPKQIVQSSSLEVS